MAAQLETLQRGFEDSLSAIGYEGSAGKLPLTLRQNQRVVHFLEWAVSTIQPGNCLTTEETERFEELRSSGRVLEVEALDQALTTLSCGAAGHREEEEEGEEGVAEVGQTRENIAQLKTQLHTLNCVHKSLSEHYGTLVREREELASQKLLSQRRYQQATDEAQNDNTKVNAALEGLVASTQEVCSFHRGTEGAGPPEATPTFLHEASQQPYHQAEDQYLSELTAYSKKQFFQGIAELAASSVDGTGTEEVGVVDLSDPAKLLLRGSSPEQYGKHSTELNRLRQLYPLVEVQCVNACLTEGHAKAACQAAEEELGLLSQQPAPLDHSTLRLQIQSKQEREAELRRQLHELCREEDLPALLRETAALQVTTVLQGDYDVKLARQQYFTSKQDKVIASLRSQQARQEVLSMLYEVELRRHRETHRLLTASSRQLELWASDREGRLEALRSGLLQLVTSPRKAIDSRDNFAQRLCTLLDVQTEPTVPLVTHSALENAVERLAQRATGLEARLSASHKEELTLAAKQEELVKELTREVFGSSVNCAQKPLLSVKEYQEECGKLQSLLSSLESNIKSLLKDFDSKKKVLQSNPLLERERELFVYFFTEPSRLGQVMAEVSGQVDALAAAATSTAQPPQEEGSQTP